eukprot:jgi/Picsp_1/3728/NSC_06564-R1_uncoupling protein ucp-4 solute carrier family 25 member 27 variant 1
MVIAVPKRLPYPIDRNARGNSVRNGAAVAVCAVGAGLFLSTSCAKRKTRTLGSSRSEKLFLNQTVIDCISGAAGEIAALVSLYPLDTLKVQCQARSTSLATALRFIFGHGPRTAISMFYAGVGSATVGAAVVGALHLSIYHFWKRWGVQVDREISQMDGKPDGPGPMQTLSSVLGATFSSISVSLVEAPWDQMKLRSQANAIKGSPILNLVHMISSQGIHRTLSSSFVPFVMKSVPHDVSELVSFSAMNESKFILQCLESVPQSARDAIMGAASGLCAAMISTPFDVICTKTNLESGSNRKGMNLKESMNNFRMTAKREWCQSGVRGLYVGFMPRLLQMIPAGIIYWAVVESTRRHLESINGTQILPEISPFIETLG